MEFKVYLRKINYNLAKDNNILKLKNNYYRKRSLLLDNLNKSIFYSKIKKCENNELLSNLKLFIFLKLEI